MQAEAPETQAETKASAIATPAKIIELVEKFERDQDIYRSSSPKLSRPPEKTAVEKRSKPLSASGNGLRKWKLRLKGSFIE